MGLSPGLDFETKLFYKADAAKVLEAELANPRYVCKPIMLGINTDPYQPIEKRLEVTRSHPRACWRAAGTRCRSSPKSALVSRDIDLLADLARERLGSPRVMSITTLERRNQAHARAARRFAAGAAEGDPAAGATAGIPVGVLVAPVIPAITDHEMEQHPRSGGGGRREQARATSCCACRTK